MSGKGTSIDDWNASFASAKASLLKNMHRHHPDIAAAWAEHQARTSAPGEGGPPELVEFVDDNGLAGCPFTLTYMSVLVERRSCSPPVAGSTIDGVPLATFVAACPEKGASSLWRTLAHLMKCVCVVQAAQQPRVSSRSRFAQWIRQVECINASARSLGHSLTTAVRDQPSLALDVFAQWGIPARREYVKEVASLLCQVIEDPGPDCLALAPRIRLLCVKLIADSDKGVDTLVRFSRHVMGALDEDTVVRAAAHVSDCMNQAYTATVAPGPDEEASGEESGGGGDEDASGEAPDALAYCHAQFSGFKRSVDKNPIEGLLLALDKIFLQAPTAAPLPPPTVSDVQEGLLRLGVDAGGDPMEVSEVEGGGKVEDVEKMEKMEEVAQVPQAPQDPQDPQAPQVSAESIILQ